MSNEQKTKCKFCNKELSNCICSFSIEEKDYDVIVDMLQKNGYEYEATQIDDDMMELELWTDDITRFMSIPIERIKALEQYYTIISYSPKLKTIEGETFASLVLTMKWKGGNDNKNE